MRARIRPIGTTLLLVVVGLAAWAFWLEPSSLRIEPVRVAVSGIPEACSGLRIAAIADLHVGSPFNGPERVQRLVQSTNAHSPDVVLLLGDFVIQGVLGGSFVTPETIADILLGLEAPLGVYGVLGNHDWWHDARLVEAAFESRGIPILEDEALRLPNPSCPLWIAGISDYWEGQHDVAKALSDVPQEAPVIAFTHNPDVFPDIPARVSLTLAGHTHGGQVHLPGIGRPIVPSAFGQRFAAGLVEEAGQKLFVDTGVGTSILPIRFRVPPQVSVLELEVIQDS